jgi:hypothetical protein
MAGYTTPYASSQRYQDPYGATIADVIGRSGQQRADALRRQGEISGQMWSGLGQTIAGTIGQIAQQREQAPLDAAKLKAAQQGVEIGDMRIADAKREDLDRSRQRSISSAMETALSGSLTKDPATGLVTYDRNTLLTSMADLGIPQETLGKYIPVLDAADQAIKSAKAAHVEALKHSAQLIDMAGNDPAVFRTEIQRGIANRLFTEDEAKPYLAAAEKDPTHIGRITGSLLGRDPNAGQFTLNPGDVRFGPDGKPIVSNPKPEEGPKASDYEWVTVPGQQEPVQVVKGQAPAGSRPYQPPPQRDPTAEPLVQVMGPNGVPVWTPRHEAVGKPAAQAPRAVTGQERQTLAFYNRAKGAVDTLTDGGEKSLEARMASQSLAGQVQLKSNINLLQSGDQQRYRQAQRAFTEARLRKESGAAIPESEFENDARTYFAQPGDDAKTIAQKAAARQAVLDGLKFSSGKAYEEYYGEPNVSPARGGDKDPMGIR